MSPYDSYRPPGQGRALLIWSAAGAIAILLAGALAWAFQVQQKGARIDPQTLCDRKGPTAVTALLLDATDVISPLQRRAVENRLATVLKDLQANERLDVYAIGGGDRLLKPVFAKCRPAAPEEVSELTGNRKLAEQRFQKEFRAELDGQLSSLMEAPATDRSPIMEAVQAAAVQSLQAPDLRAGAPGFRRQLVLVSDLLENGPAGSHYGPTPVFETYRKTPAFATYRSDLAGTDVIVLHLGREGARHLQTNGHVDFWDAWFRAQGVGERDFVPIEG